MINIDDKIDDGIKMFLHCWPFWWPWRCAEAVQTALPDAAYPGLPRKPLDAAIGWLFALYCPSGRQSNSKQNDKEKMDQLCWPFWWPRQCVGQYRARCPMDEVQGFGRSHWTLPCNWSSLPWFLFEFFHRQLVKKGHGLMLRPLFAIGELHIKQKRKA